MVQNVKSERSFGAKFGREKKERKRIPSLSSSFMTSLYKEWSTFRANFSFYFKWQFRKFQLSPQSSILGRPQFKQQQQSRGRTIAGAEMQQSFPEQEQGDQEMIIIDDFNSYTCFFIFQTRKHRVNIGFLFHVFIDVRFLFSFSDEFWQICIVTRYVLFCSFTPLWSSLLSLPFLFPSCLLIRCLLIMVPVSVCSFCCVVTSFLSSL